MSQVRAVSPLTEKGSTYVRSVRELGAEPPEVRGLWRNAHGLDVTSSGRPFLGLSSALA